jgi:hypothetical protein
LFVLCWLALSRRNANLCENSCALGQSSRAHLAGLLRVYNTTYSNISLNRSILLRLPLSSEG